MKNLFLSIIALGCTVVAGAQNEEVSAILQTGDETSIYFGPQALINAYNDAAETGSVITLTAGTFNTPTNIKKSVSIYGVGWEGNPTIISGKIYYFTDDADQFIQQIRLEGVYVTSDIFVKQTKEFVISKCRFGNLDPSGINVEDIQVIQCYFSAVTSNTNNSYKFDRLSVQNCYIAGRLYHFCDDSHIVFDHCIIRAQHDYAVQCKALYKNCIFGDYYHPGLSGGSVIKNCIFEFGEGSVSGCTKEGTNYFSVPATTIFSDDEDNNVWTYTPERTFTLTNPELWVGDDGTPIGLQGGIGFVKVPSTPVVKSLTTTQEGQTLKVSYEAEVR